MSKRIIVIQGHPDPSGARFGNALADAYVRGAIAAGHEVKRIEVARLDFPWLRTRTDFEDRDPPPIIAAAQDDLAWAEHWVILYPLWHGCMPAVFKAFVEQTLRPGFAHHYDETLQGKPLLTGRSARIFVTMAMPAFIYRWYFFGHSLRNLKRNILGFVGVWPIADTLIGSIESLDTAKAQRWLAKAEAMGRRGS